MGESNKRGRVGAFHYPMRDYSTYAYERLLDKAPELEGMLGLEIRAIFIEGA